MNLQLQCSQPQNPCEALILLAASRICLIHSFASFFYFLPSIVIQQDTHYLLTGQVKVGLFLLLQI